MDEEDKCIVCFDKQPNGLFLRCKHRLLQRLR
jgi:hypothetical protein